jgi:hypothetical protein
MPGGDQADSRRGQMHTSTTALTMPTFFCKCANTNSAKSVERPLLISSAFSFQTSFTSFSVSLLLMCLFRTYFPPKFDFAHIVHSHNTMQAPAQGQYANETAMRCFPFPVMFSINTVSVTLVPFLRPVPTRFSIASTPFLHLRKLDSHRLTRLLEARDFQNTCAQK